MRGGAGVVQDQEDTEEADTGPMRSSIVQPMKNEQQRNEHQDDARSGRHLPA